MQPSNGLHPNTGPSLLFCTPLLSLILSFLHANDMAMLVSSSKSCHDQWEASVVRAAVSRTVYAEYMSSPQFRYMSESKARASSIPMSVFNNVDLDVIQTALYSLQLKPGAHKAACAIVATRGNFKIFQWMYMQTLKGAFALCIHSFVHQTCIEAARHGHIHILHWLYKTHRTLSVDLVEKMYHAAAKEGCLLSLYWLNAAFTVQFYSPLILSSAALSGSLEVVRWFCQLTPPFPINDEFCFAAARAGHLHLLQWAYEHHPHIFHGVSTTAGAALGGHLEILQWARSRNPPLEWCVSTTKGAAREGHLRVLQWVFQQTPRAPYTWTTMLQATQAGQLDIVRWMVEQHLFELRMSEWNQIMNVATGAGHLHLVKWISTQFPSPIFFDLHKICNEAAWAGHLTIIQWLYEQGIPHLGWRSLLWATCRRHWHICQWVLFPQKQIWMRDVQVVGRCFIFLCLLSFFMYYMGEMWCVPYLLYFF